MVFGVQPIIKQMIVIVVFYFFGYTDGRFADTLHKNKIDIVLHLFRI